MAFRTNGTQSEIEEPNQKEHSAAETLSLLEQVIELTGLPQDALRKEMNRALSQLQQNPEDLDLESLRQLVANYVQDVLVELKDNFENEN